ncbi:hypothetical protein MWMV17_MWMV17_03018 [Acinetobacter calcoaceticus]|uniref:FG-GAP repeat protein n=1 Tax=Acinetobacter calcoaceticus DSM 30006 = CIP 81.8 TaxID=981331 RepID=A0ABP2UBJ3_ACICA|nr:hypothetical protein [Acinetobacter calcoaceticus]ENV96914.1 hypothetical protein F936_03587 [Acinetobacter calcoaceticus DSM 30006 = CIP 81.8]CAI3156052.1 hypothetical protein MWMV17_MWMV17_03018 [Acinetobacter calcoaceticus]
MTNRLLITTSLLLINSTLFAQAVQIPKSEVASIFKAADFKKTKHGWKGNCDTGEIIIYQDLNGDGRKDAVIQDSSSMCYGNTGVGYHIISQQKDGKWKQLFSDSGIPTFLKTKGKDGWLDIENGGPGFCFAIYRWNGKEYIVNRYEYQGKACQL